MQRLQGIAVSPGVAIAEAAIFGHEGFRISRRFLSRESVNDELQRLDQAIAAAADEIDLNRQRVADQLGDEYAAIFSAHLQMLQDPKLRNELDQMIRERHYSPEYSVSRAMRRYAKVFLSLEGDTMAERANDVFDIEKRLLRNLLGERREGPLQLTSEVLILAHNLTPSETANLNPEFVKGFVTEVGGPGSHTAIVAEALDIPAVVGVGPFLTEVSGGETVIIDGDNGLVILQPDEETLARYRHEVDEQLHLAQKLEELRDYPSDTLDGQHITLLGNIEFPSEARQSLDQGAEGVGLYRTEFLYLTQEVQPDEEDHVGVYRQVLSEMRGYPVVMRTVDLGADKMPNFPLPDDERNPFLGLRSIRLALKHVDMFRTQLRAMLRASTAGNLRIMFPLITNLMELRRAKMVLSDAMEDLDEQGIPYSRDIEIGMMVEVPSAVVMMDHFVEEVDFFSIGTNDLIQYALAVDRSNKDVASLYTGSDPSVLRFVKMAIDAAAQHNRPISMCGQMCGNPIYTMVLIGLGLRTFSVVPAAIPEIKRVCRSVTISQCEKLAARILSLESARDVRAAMREELIRILPDQPV